MNVKTKKKSINSTAGKLTVLAQLCKHIPSHVLGAIVRKHKSEAHTRTFSHWSHVVALLYSKVCHCFGLNDLCDQLDIHSGALSPIRGATAPKRNTLSHANSVRPAAIAQDLFWATLEHLREQTPSFGRRAFPGRLKKLNRTIEILDSTVIELVANCMNWAQHRRKKAAAKAHMRLNLESALPSCVIIGPGKDADVTEAEALTKDMKHGEICIFDRGYVSLLLFRALTQRGIIWVTRWKKGLKADVLEQRPVKGKILADELLALNDGQPVRRIRALVEIDGEEREMEFMTNHLEWSAELVVALYKQRWEIEVFFKQMKQVLRLCDFVGNSANAIRWQIWMALLAHLLIRYMAWTNSWERSYTRLFALLRGTIWEKRDISSLLERYGIAEGTYRMVSNPGSAYFAFYTETCGTAGA